MYKNKKKFNMYKNFALIAKEMLQKLDHILCMCDAQASFIQGIP